MNNFNTKANSVMSNKARTESFFNMLSFFILCLAGASLFVMLCIIINVISLDNWPF